ncbi:MAG: nucleotidyl transferase AbiEii/AbiGii toxin family protein [Isosphaeraceae bacterium]
MSGMETVPFGDPSWERTLRAVERVKDRLLRATAALERSGVNYAVVGGNAVAAWVGQVDPSAVRFTQDVDLLIRRGDLGAARAALEAVGFRYQHSAGIDKFRDGPDARARDAVHVVFAGERVRPDYLFPSPDLSEAEDAESFRVLRLEALVRMKLTSFRDKDRTHLRDLIDVGLVDETWPARLPEELAARLQGLLDTPNG